MISKSLRPSLYSFALFTLVYGFFILLLITVGGCATTSAAGSEASKPATVTPSKVVACDNKILKDFGAVRGIPVAPGVSLILNQAGEILSVTATETLAPAEEMLKKNGYVSDKSFKPVVCSIEGQTVIVQKWTPKAGA
jgi:hypothetical protein